MNECKYCNGFDAPISADGAWKVATIDNDLQHMRVHDTVSGEDFWLDIKFCPMCGRELKEEL